MKREILKQPPSDHILVHSRYGIATIVEQRALATSTVNASDLAPISSDSIDEFIIPGHKRAQNFVISNRFFDKQRVATPEVYFTIPGNLAKDHHYGLNRIFEKQIEQGANCALQKLTDPEIANAWKDDHNKERHDQHTITEAINFAAQKASAKIDEAHHINNKSPIILIHGFRGAPIGLKAIQELLQKAHYKVLAPAISPFAGAKPLAAYTPRAYADFIAQFIEEQHLYQPVLVGHSMGSIVASAVATHYADLINQKLILMSPISVHTPKFVGAISPLAGYLPTKLVDYATTKYLTLEKDQQKFHQIIDITHQCSSIDAPRPSDLWQATKFSTSHAVGDFAFKKTTLLLAGEKDRLIRASDTLKLAEKIDAETVFLKGTGHLHNYEKPVETADAILQFLQ